MMFSYVILIRFIYITSTVLLFSDNAYSVYNKNEVQTLHSSKTAYNTSNNIFSSVKSHAETETCVYNTENRLRLQFIAASLQHTKSFYQLPFFVLKATQHPDNCSLTHNVDNVISIFMAARICKDDHSILKLAYQLSRNVSIADGVWSSKNILDMSAAISKCSGPDIEYIRKIIANKIVNPNNDMSMWQPCMVAKELRSLSMGNSKMEEKAFKHIVEYLITKNCNIDQLGGQQLSQLFRSLSHTNTDQTKIAILKVFGVIIKSGLSYWNAKSTLTMFRDLVELQKSHSTFIQTEKSYKIVLQLIINRLASSELNLRACDSNDIVPLMKGLWQIDKLSWPVNIDKARRRWAKFIVEEDMNISPMASNDCMMIIRGLTPESRIEQEAMRTLAEHFHGRIAGLSQWTKSELLNVATAFTHNDRGHIEKVIPKIASFVASENLNSWDTSDLSLLATALSPKNRDVHHTAIDNIAYHILNKPNQFSIGDYIDLSLIVSRGQGYHCLKLIRYISNEIAYNNFDLSHRSLIFLAKLVSIASKDDGEYAEKALNKITTYLIDKSMEQWLELPPESFKLIASACSKYYKLMTARHLLKHIVFIILYDLIDLSYWPIDTLDIVLRKLDGSNDYLIQRSLRKIVAKLNLPDTTLREWSINTLARVAKGVSRLRDYSSEEFITRLTKMYMEKRNCDDIKYGMTILLAICHLPIASEKIIKEAVNLASVLYDNAYSNMTESDKISLFWAITLLDFVVHEEGRINTTETTKTIIIELIKIIPKIKQNTINKHTKFLAAWQLEFINIMRSYRAHKSSDINISTYENRLTPEVNDHIHRLIKTKTSGFSVDTNCLINKFPTDCLLRSRSKSLLVEVDGPHHFFHDSNNRRYRLVKDRFVDFVFEKQLDYKIIRIDYQEAYDYRCRKHLIQQILTVFPYHTH
ncbi:MAG: hypothetical protein QS748_06375 [Candidatus Endonucleobacter bathymodioli]|uniref:RAP domain-containing protein n=1 Tax=Candidatus Endonucleibacter bathymodioli TaxID=539814 RepID=A0AA90SSR3_9GAMM|nr:hypothetical protein [Candidatus Endonucleobacter bathymodioli]